MAKAREDHRIQVFRSEVNQGAAKTRNNSLSHAKGRYIAFLDSDDLWTAEKLEHQLAYMKQNGCAMCYTDYDIISGDGEYRKTVRVPSSVTFIFSGGVAVGLCLIILLAQSKELCLPGLKKKLHAV